MDTGFRQYDALRAFWDRLKDPPNVIDCVAESPYSATLNSHLKSRILFSSFFVRRQAHADLFCFSVFSIQYLFN